MTKSVVKTDSQPLSASQTGFQIQSMVFNQIPNGFPIQLLPFGYVWQRAEDTIDDLGSRHRVVDTLYASITPASLLAQATALATTNNWKDQDSNVSGPVTAQVYSQGANTFTLTILAKSGGSLASWAYVTPKNN